MRSFDLYEPTSQQEALGLLAEWGDASRLLGGGAMLAILLRERLIAPRCLISTLKIPEIGGSPSGTSALRIGGATTLRQIEQSKVVTGSWPVLAEAAHVIGNVRVRTVGTIGGHLVQADPHLDLPPVLAALDAQVVVASERGVRTLPVNNLFVGYYETSIEADEMVVRVEIPAMPAGLHGSYLKFSSVSRSDWPTVGVAAFFAADGRGIRDVRIVAGSVAEQPLRVTQGEALLEGESLKASAIAETARLYAKAADPLSDARGSAEYKREITAVFVGRAVRATAARAGVSIKEDE